MTPTEYVYKNGQESGVIIGIINYPRFPRSQDELWTVAVELTNLLMIELCQSSATIETPESTHWLSTRENEQSPGSTS